MEPLSSRPGGSNRTCLDQDSRLISGEPCLAYLDRGKRSKTSIPKETAASPSNTSGGSQSSSQESTKPIEKASTGWPEELPSRNIYDYPDNDFDPQICPRHLQALNLYWCPLHIVKDHLPCRRFFMAKVHELYGKKTSAPPSDPAVHVAIASVAEPGDVERSEAETGGADRSARRTVSLPSIDVADVGRSPAEASASVRTPCPLLLVGDSRPSPARKPKAKLKFAPSQSIGAIVSPGLERTCPPDVRSACERICPDDGGPGCAWFNKVLTELPPTEGSFAAFGRRLRRLLPGERRFPIVLTKTPQGVGKQNHEQGLKLARFTIDESVPVPPSRYVPGIPFTIDEGAKKERLTWDQVKHWTTEYCYRAETEKGYQPNHRRKSFEVSSILLIVVLHLRPGELRNIRWRDLKARYVTFPDSPRKAGQRVDYGSFTEVVVELLKSWRMDAELDTDFVFDFTERTLERIAHRILGADVMPANLRRLKEFHVNDESVEQYSLVKALRTLKAGTGLRTAELFQLKEETHRYNTGLEHGFTHPDPQVTRHIKHQRLSGWKGKGVDH